MPSDLRREVDHQRKERTKRSLLEAAIIAFAKRGYHHTLISDIVAEAGVGQGTFYRYFGSKREVIEVIFEDFVADALRQFSDMSEHLPQNLEEYRAASLQAVRSLIAILESRRAVIGIILREAYAVDSEFEAKLDEMTNQLADLARFYLEHAIAHGFARPCQTELVAQCIVGQAQRVISLWWKNALPLRDAEALSVEIIDFVFCGLAPQGCVGPR